MPALRCAVMGHRRRFWAEGATMRWECELCGREPGSKEYPSETEAQRFAAAFDRRDTAELGKRAPLIGMFPLRLWHRLRGARR